MKQKKWLYVAAAGVVVIGVAVWLVLSFTRGTELPEMDAWSRVGHFQSTNELDSMQQALDDYLWTYGDGRYADDARMLRERLNRERQEWETLSTSQDLPIEQLENYLDANLEGFFRRDALLLLDSVAYVAALEVGTEESLLRYMEQYADSRFVEKARNALKNVGDTEASAAECDSVTNAITTHFAAMQNNSPTIVSTMSENISSYIGKPNPTIEDILAYMSHFHRGNTKKVLATSDFAVKKMQNTIDELPLFSVSFQLVETFNPDDSTKMEVKRLQGTAIVDNEWKIASLVLEQKKD